MEKSAIEAVVAPLLSADAFTVAVRGFSAIEEVLTHFLVEALAQSDHLEISRLSCAFKIDLCIALDLMPTDDAAVLRKLLKVRNSFAHQFNFVLSEQSVTDIWNTFSDRKKKSFDSLVPKNLDYSKRFTWFILSEWASLARLRESHREAKISNQIWLDLLAEEAARIEKAGVVKSDEPSPHEFEYRKRYKQKTGNEPK